jgi:hypothetical protein
MKFLGYFSTWIKLCIDFDKNGRATLWAISSQTRLVTLLRNYGPLVSGVLRIHNLAAKYCFVNR